MNGKPTPTIRDSLARAAESVNARDTDDDDELAALWKHAQGKSDEELSEEIRAQSEALRVEAEHRRSQEARRAAQRQRQTEERWQRRLQEAHLLQDHVNEALISPIDANRLRDATMKWFAHASAMFRECARQSRSGTLELSAPVNLFAAVSYLFDDLGRGRIPKTISAVSARGNTAWGAGEAISIGYAVAYLRYVRAKRIVDKHPTKTIQNAYDVKRNTVQKWAKQEIPAQVRENCEDFDSDLALEEWLRFKIDDHGAVYQKWGRGEKAVIAREAKRTRHNK